MAEVIGEVMFPNGKYISGNEEKTRWLKCGVLLQTDNGMRLKLECLPINMNEGWFNIFDPKPKDGQQSAPAGQSGFRNSAPSSGGKQDDIPF